MNKRNKTKEKIKELSYLIRAEYRKFILKELTKFKTPKELTEDLKRIKETKYKSRFETISRTLKQLLEKGFIKCLNPKEKRGRIYILTEKGKTYLRILETRNL